MKSFIFSAFFRTVFCPKSHFLKSFLIVYKYVFVYGFSALKS